MESSNKEAPVTETDAASNTSSLSKTNNLDHKSSGQTKTTKLLKSILASGDIVLFKDQNNTPYANISIGHKSVNLPIASTDFTSHLRHRLYTQAGEIVSDSNLKEISGTLATKAQYGEKQHDLYHRVAQQDGNIYYNLQNTTGEVVEVTKDGWSVVSGSKVPFLFKEGCGKPQVTPVTGGDLKDLAKLINIKNQDELMLFLSTLPVRMIQDIDQAITYIHGPAGSAKTTLLRMVKDLLDPSAGGVSLPIRKVDSLLTLLNQTWVFANDNISKIDNDLSDVLCMVATGGEDARRTLYTDTGLTVLKIKNPAYITGVNVEASKSDLMSRIMLFKTETVPRSEVRSGADINAEFEALKPQLLGAIFDTLVQAMNIKETLNHRSSFRMNDFALWGAACAEALGYGAISFESALEKASKNRAYDAIYTTSAGRALLNYLEEHGDFEGTMTDLLRGLKESRAENDNEWHETVATNPSALSKRLRELENSLSAVGVTVDFLQRSGSERLVHITSNQSATDVETESIEVAVERTRDPQTDQLIETPKEFEYDTI